MSVAAVHSGYSVWVTESHLQTESQPTHKETQRKGTHNVFVLVIPLWQPLVAISYSVWQKHVSGAWTPY